MQPGDVLFVAGTGISDALIRWGQGCRPSLRPTARWTHCALVISDSGDIIEAVHTGVRTSHVTAYGDHETAIVPITASDEDRAEMVRYATAQLDREYGVLDILSLGLALFTGGTINVFQDGHSICSQLVAESLERAGYIWPHDAASMCPAELFRLLEAN